MISYIIIVLNYANEIPFRTMKYQLYHSIMYFKLFNLEIVTIYSMSASILILVIIKF